MDAIALIKSVVNVLKGYEAHLVLCIRLFVYHQVQTFSLHTMVPIVHHADKKKLQVTKDLQELRLIVREEKCVLHSVSLPTAVLT